jgi:hypothetical protein
MADKNPSQAQQESSSFDPMAMWSRISQDSITRMQAYYEELATYEAKAYDRAKTTTAQLTEMANESLTYATKLAAEWRTLTMEATKRGAEMFRAKA